jgi:hypothetical protein
MLYSMKPILKLIRNARSPPEGGGEKQREKSEKVDHRDVVA